MLQIEYANKMLLFIYRINTSYTKPSSLFQVWAFLIKELTARVIILHIKSGPQLFLMSPSAHSVKEFNWTLPPKPANFLTFLSVEKKMRKHPAMLLCARLILHLFRHYSYKDINDSRITKHTGTKSCMHRNSDQMASQISIPHSTALLFYPEKEVVRVSLHRAKTLITRNDILMKFPRNQTTCILFFADKRQFFTLFKCLYAANVRNLSINTYCLYTIAVTQCFKKLFRLIYISV